MKHFTTFPGGTPGGKCPRPLSMPAGAHASRNEWSSANRQHFENHGPHDGKR